MTHFNFRPLFCALIAILFSSPMGHAASGDWQWASDAGGPSDDVFRSLAIDSSGELIVSGIMSGPATMGTNRLNGQRYGMIARYKSDGQLRWARQLTAGDADKFPIGTSVEVDPEGDTYTSVVSVESDQHVYLIAKYRADGTQVYSKRFNAAFGHPPDGLPFPLPPWPWAMSVAPDGQGGLFMVGNYQGTQVVGPGLVTSSDLDTIFIAKLGSDGNPLWITNAALPASGSVAYLASLCRDGAGGIWIAGGANGPFLAHYNPSGQVLWSGMITVPNSVAPETIYSIQKIALASNGDVVVAGSGSISRFLARYNDNGNPLWWTTIGTVASASTTGLALDGHGNIRLAGFLNGAATFGSQTITNRSQLDIFLAEYDGGGNFRNVVRAGSPNASNLDTTPALLTQQEFPTSLVVDAVGNVFLAGFYSSEADFDDFQLITPGFYANAFIARFQVAPWVASQPGSQTKLTGQTAYFWVRMKGASPFQYQWLKNGLPMQGETNALLTLPGISTNSAGLYSVKVSNQYSSTVSDQAPLVVNLEGIELELTPRLSQLYASLKVVGLVGRHYLIQSSTDTLSPWTTLTNITLTTPSQSWLDPEPATGTQRYYRAVPQP